MRVKGTSIDSWICTLSPEFTVAALLSACNRITITCTQRLALENSESQSAQPRINRGARISQIETKQVTTKN